MVVLRLVMLCGLLLFCRDVLAEGYELLESYPVDVREPSGLTYDPQTDTLWTVQDGGGGIYQIDKQGKVLETINIPSDDLEGIAYKPDTDTFLLAEERKREILEVDRQGKVLREINTPIKYSFWHINHGLEGVCYDPRRQSIFVANEKSPRMVVGLDMRGDVVGSFDVEGVGDLSGMCYDDTNGNLLVLSHESRKVMEFTPDGKLLRSFSIDFPISIEKAEGIAKDADGKMYIICEKRKVLYVYTPVK